MIHCDIWGSAAISHLKPLQVLQNRVLKSINSLPSLYPTNELYSLTGILPIKGLYCYQICLFMKKNVLGRNYSTIEFKAT